MNRINQILTGIVCAIVITLSWIVAIGSESTEEKQINLMKQADMLIRDEIYITAVPLLEEAAGYDSTQTKAAEEKLKEVYLALIDKRGYARKYTALLDKQMNGTAAAPDVFEEAAGYYLSINAKQDAFAVLRKGIEKTADASLISLYESIRYAYELSRDVYDEAGAVYGQTLQIGQNGRWGIINLSGSVMIPCEYDKVSTFSQERVIVMKDGAIYAVDRNNNRIAVAPEGAREFRNLSENRIALRFDEGWRRASGDFELGTTVFEDIGVYSEGYAAAKTGGKWGVTDIGSGWLVPAEYDGVIQDEHGRCFAQGAVFVRSGETVYLYLDGARTENTYQDARSFYGEGYAAVRQNGKWGFIDTAGNVMIDFIFDDAKSFSGHLAAVKTGGLWGYASITGDIVIDAVFLDAGSFSQGSAPVRTDRGWQIITLTEYKKERIL